MCVYAYIKYKKINKYGKPPEASRRPLVGSSTQTAARPSPPRAPSQATPSAPRGRLPPRLWPQKLERRGPSLSPLPIAVGKKRDGAQPPRRHSDQ